MKTAESPRPSRPAFLAELFETLTERTRRLLSLIHI